MADGAFPSLSNTLITANLLSWLHSDTGADLLRRAALLPPDRLTRLTRLRREVSAEMATAAVELLELRQRAKGKFRRAGEMFFTPEGLEQATGEAIAAYRAGRFPEGVGILDACCGVGGDAIALAARGRVFAVDRNPAAAFCTGANAALQGAPVSTLCADVTALDLRRLERSGIGAAFFDPSRRVSDIAGERRRARNAEDYAPPLSWVEALQERFPALAVKVSPAIDDAAACRYNAHVEFLSDRGECKEAVLWFGALANPGGRSAHSGENYVATVLRPEMPPATLAPFACDPPEVLPPRAWLYEPDPAVIRAHLIPQIAALLTGSLLDPQIAYLTADTFTPTPFATAYRVLEVLPYHFKQVQARLVALGRHVVAIKKRGVPLEPAEVRRSLPGVPSGNLPAIVVLTRRAEKTIALLCEPVNVLPGES